MRRRALHAVTCRYAPLCAVTHWCGGAPFEDDVALPADTCRYAHIARVTRRHPSLLTVTLHHPPLPAVSGFGAREGDGDGGGRFFQRRLGRPRRPAALPDRRAGSAHSRAGAQGGGGGGGGRGASGGEQGGRGGDAAAPHAATPCRHHPGLPTPAPPPRRATNPRRAAATPCRPPRATAPHRHHVPPVARRWSCSRSSCASWSRTN